MKLLLGRLKVSDEDYDFVVSLTISFDSKGYARVWFEGKHRRLHFLIAQRTGMDLRFGREVDHMDRDKNNNERWNLRPATGRQSQLNQGIQVDNSSGFLGVGWSKQQKAYLSYARVNGRQYHLGYFKTSKEAAFVRDHFCWKSFDREFYVYNFPKELDFSDLRIRLRFHLGKGIQCSKS